MTHGVDAVWDLDWLRTLRWGVQIALCEGTIFKGKKYIAGHARPHSTVSCAKIAEPIKMPFGLWTQVGPRKHVLGGKYTGAH